MLIKSIDQLSLYAYMYTDIEKNEDVNQMYEFLHRKNSLKNEDFHMRIINELLLRMDYNPVNT